MIISLGTKSGSGKDTVANMMQYLIALDRSKKEFVQKSIFEQGYEVFDYTALSGFEVKKFADPIKDTLCLWLGCSRKDLEDRDSKEKNLGENWNVLTPRIMLQLLGTECGRNIIHEDIWVNILFRDYDKESNWIITDLRFPNEFKAIKERGGVTIRIDRDEESGVPEHTSEIALDSYKFDYVIDNNGTKDELLSNVIDVLVEIGVINN